MGGFDLLKKLVDFLSSINYRKQLVITFVFGVIFASFLNPLVVPPIQDYQVEHGWIPTPEPELTLQYRNTSTSSFIDDQVEVDLTEQRYRTFFLKVKNPTRKLITDLSVTMLFSGCVQKVGVFHTSIDAAILARNADEIKTGRMIGGQCAATVNIEEVPPEKAAMIFVVVDTESINNHFSEAEQLEERQVALFATYQWTHNGRMYFEPIERFEFVDDRLSAGELFN